MTDFNTEVQEKPGKYMRLEQGENTFRMLSKPIRGWLQWLETEKGRKPIRKTSEVELTADEFEDHDFFWAMVVWNYKTNMIQILEIKQKTIIKPIAKFWNNKAWGSPRGYDLVISKEGEMKETEYQVMPSPKKELSKEIEEAYKKRKIDLEKLYATKEEPYGGDPFEQEKDDKDEVLDKKGKEDVDPDDLPF